jgi:uncharacterized protein YndB with AHSA1/START domain
MAAGKNKPNELYISRVYDAPVKAVWDAWTDDKQVVQWWGPRGFTLTTHSKDLKPGGHWKYTMHGPDGTDWENKTVYHEVEKYKKLVYDHGGGEDRPPLFRVTVHFNEEAGKTKMEMTMALPTEEAAKETKKFIKQANGNSTWDRLAEYLDKNLHGKEGFVINRTFDAPIEKTWSAWIKADFIWTPPAVFKIDSIRTKFVSENDHQTRITVELEPRENASREEIESFIKTRADLSQCWNETFDKIETNLEKL